MSQLIDMDSKIAEAKRREQAIKIELKQLRKQKAQLSLRVQGTADRLIGQAVSQLLRAGDPVEAALIAATVMEIAREADSDALAVVLDRLTAPAELPPGNSTHTPPTAGDVLKLPVPRDSLAADAALDEVPDTLADVEPLVEVVEAEVHAAPDAKSETQTVDRERQVSSGKPTEGSLSLAQGQPTSVYRRRFHRS